MPFRQFSSFHLIFYFRHFFTAPHSTSRPLSPPTSPQASNQSILSAAAGSARPSLPAIPRWSNHHHVAPVCPVIGCPAHRACLCAPSNVPKPQLPDLIPQLPSPSQSSCCCCCCSSHKVPMMTPPTSPPNRLTNTASPFYSSTAGGRMSPLEVIFDQEHDDSVFLPSLPENCSMPSNSVRRSRHPTGGCHCQHHHHAQHASSHYSSRYPINRFSNYDSSNGNSAGGRRSASVSLPLDMEAIREVGISLRRMSESFASSRRSHTCVSTK